MSRLLPSSLFGQTLLILLVGLVASHLLGGWIYASDRDYAVRAVASLAMAERIVNLARLIEDAPPDWRRRIAAASSDESFEVSLAAAAPPWTRDAGQGEAAQAVAEVLGRALDRDGANQVRVALSGRAGPALPLLHDHPMPMAPLMHAAAAWRELKVAIALADGNWLAVAARLPDAGPSITWRFTLSLAMMAVVILGAAAWAVRRVTHPLAEIAAAAERLGQDVGGPPLAEIGSAEMRRAARAFNGMQQRLKRLIENRTHLLAAISHDLRTPLTLLRLRAETVENVEERDKMLATIAEMVAMIEATLAYARDEAAAEPKRPTDVAALLSSLAADMADAGMPVTFAPPPSPLIVPCRPLALKRALANLVDNAVKYGKSAHLAARATSGGIAIAVEDEGPGIPESELERVLEPFYRIDDSRSRATGGIGLGLAIARSIVEAHGGNLTLENRGEGGLRATITLPR